MFSYLRQREPLKIFQRESDLKTLPRDEQQAVRESVELARGLEGALKSTRRKALPLKLEGILHKGQQYKTVSMPGTDTRALGAAPVGSGGYLRALTQQAGIGAGAASQFVFRSERFMGKRMDDGSAASCWNEAPYFTGR